MEDELTRPLDPSLLTRWRSLAQTWMRKSVALMLGYAQDARNDDEGWLVGYEAARLLREILWESGALVSLLNEEDLEDSLHYARKLADQLRARKLHLKLSRVEGRTPEEAASFSAKAEELKGTNPMRPYPGDEKR